MKTTDRTDNTNEQPVYVLKRSIWYKIGVYLMLAMGLFLGGGYWAIYLHSARLLCYCKQSGIYIAMKGTLKDDAFCRL